MKKILSFLSVCALAGTAFGQAAYVFPTPTPVEDTVWLYVNLADPGCNCPNLVNPTEDIFMWTWQPGDPTVGNGDWDNSNEAMKMTQDENDPNLWYMKMVPTDFYGVDDATVYANGFSYLAKFKDGGSGGGTELENKSQDFNLGVVAPPCNKKLCPHPEVFLQEDYFTVYYNNNLETNTSLQNLGTDEVHIHMRGITASGLTYEKAQQGSIWTDDQFAMVFEPSTDLYHYTIIPEDYFEIPDPEGDPLETIQVTFIKRVDPTGLGPSEWRSATEILTVGCQ